MRYSYLINPFRAYLKFPILISIALGCLGWDNILADIHRVLYQKADFSVRRSILLYHLLITFVQASKAPNKSIPIREVFSSKLKDLIRLLTNTKSFQPVSFT